jgi:anaphase-promoting complex subunit 8
MSWLELTNPFSVRPIQEYAKSCLHVAEYHMRIPDGDLYLAKEYLERVATSNAEDVMKATELLKAVKLSLQVKGETIGTVQEGGEAAAPSLQEPEGEA